MIEVVLGKDLWKTYIMGDNIPVHALRGLNISVDKGEFVSVMGPSGSGKSTLLNIIGCLDTPTKGELFLDGNKTSSMGQNELTKVRAESIGFIFQTFNLLPALTVRDNVEFPMQNLSKAKKIDKKARIKNVEDALDRVGLSNRLDYLPSKLSGGEKQRVAIARSMINHPKFILADEPTGNLDTEATKNIIELLHEINNEGTTIIMVTHDKDATKNTRLLRIKDGAIEK
jgi:putative ABC transport system ATP-binding protein